MVGPYECPLLAWQCYFFPLREGIEMVIRAQIALYKRDGIDPVILPRSAGSWPGYVFTDEPLHLAATHFGLGHGSGAHAPDEYFVVESANPKVQGMDGAVRSFVDYLYEIAQM